MKTKPISWDYIESVNPKFPYNTPELEYKPLQTWILYEKVIQGKYNNEQEEHEYSITPPILGLHFNFEPADQTMIEHNILPFRAYHENNFSDTYNLTGEEIKKIPKDKRYSYNQLALSCSAKPLMDSIDWWSDYPYVLGMWYYKPTWKEMLAVVREKSLYWKL